MESALRLDHILAVISQIPRVAIDVLAKLQQPLARLSEADARRLVLR